MAPSLKALVLLLCALCASAFVPMAHRQPAVARAQQKQLQERGRSLEMGMPGGKALASLGLLFSAATGLYAPQPAAASSFLTSRGETMVSRDVETRQGLYKDYTVDKDVQKYDDAEGTFKTKEATEGNKNKYVAILTVLLIGSAVIPMVQYWWYVKDEN